jgi:hypothetical protein
MSLIKAIGYLAGIIILLLLVVFLFCLIKAFYYSFIVKKKPYNYEKINIRNKK